MNVSLLIFRDCSGGFVEYLQVGSNTSTLIFDVLGMGQVNIFDPNGTLQLFFALLLCVKLGQNQNYTAKLPFYTICVTADTPKIIHYRFINKRINDS